MLYQFDSPRFEPGPLRTRMIFVFRQVYQSFYGMEWVTTVAIHFQWVLWKKWSKSTLQAGFQGQQIDVIPTIQLEFSISVCLLIIVVSHSDNPNSGIVLGPLIRSQLYKEPYDRRFTSTRHDKWFLTSRQWPAWDGGFQTFWLKFLFLIQVCKQLSEDPNLVIMQLVSVKVPNFFVELLKNVPIRQWKPYFRRREYPSQKNMVSNPSYTP